MSGPELLRRYLTRKKLSQAAFAAKAGVSTASVSLWLSETSRPGYESALLVQSATAGAVPYTSWRAEPGPDADGQAAEAAGVVGESAVVAKRHARKVPRPAA